MNMAISLTKISDFKFSFLVRSKSETAYNGEVDEVTGGVLAIRGGAPTLKGDLIEVDKTKKKIRDLTLRNLGEGFDVNVEYLGVNANFQSNSDMKEYCFKLQPTFKGYNIFSEYNVNTKKANPRQLYINTETGKEERVAFADGTVSH
jgi:hypothetical protein